MRRVREWVGKNDDTPIPDRVKVRIWQRSCDWYHGSPSCACCGLPILVPMIEFDHIVAICNGGENRESNIRPVHLWCHREKTRADMQRKAADYRKRRKHVLGRKQTRSSFQTNRAGPYKRKIDGTIERRR